CSTPRASGWRAMPSTVLLTIIPLPNAAPTAPRPIRIDIARNAIVNVLPKLFFMLNGWLNPFEKMKPFAKPACTSLGFFLVGHRLADVNEGQDGEQERLDGADENAEPLPDRQQRNAHEA